MLSVFPFFFRFFSSSSSSSQYPSTSSSSRVGTTLQENARFVKKSNTLKFRRLLSSPMATRHKHREGFSEKAGDCTVTLFVGSQLSTHVS